MTDTSPSSSVRAVDLPPQYNPADVEGRRYEGWVTAGYFSPEYGELPGQEPGHDRVPFAIVIPPPNVTGSLHIGHALDHSIQDAVIRRRRMQGYQTLWLPGMDHAGIATQNVVERELAREGRSRHDLGRDRFVERVWGWKASSGGAILGQMRRLGDSVDWEREGFTMDAGLSRAVQTIFKRFFDDELIYRAERIINWCPRCLTALSDIEVEHSDDEGELVSIRYGEGENAITVATTRAETMLGDTAVAVHPDDARYRHLIGTEVELPLTGRRVPIVADEHVDPAFGTGAVKVTPAHDPNDFEIGRRHHLPSVTVLDDRGVITAHGPFQGLDRFEARPAVIAALREEGRLVAERRPYLHAVGHCQRCSTVVEPRLSLQWFVNVAPLAKAAGDAVRDGRVRIHPKEMEPRYFDWVDNMHDWCISRQLWWGHRIPVWYGPNGEVRCVGPDEEPPSEQDGWQQDPDVLDTWFSSALWPFSTLGWPDDSPDLRRFYPTSVLVTGYDILFFWVARMMMFGLYAMDGAAPFRVVALHGMVRDKYGKKMSKSYGNVVDPLDWIDRFGADATRFTLLRGANPGSDVPVSEQWCQGSRNFCNKLWNATRFALQNGATIAAPLREADELSAADRWIVSRLTAVIAEVDGYYEDFQFGKVADCLYHFAWDEVCDWYLELAKQQLAGPAGVASGTRLVLGHLLDQLLRLLHPLVPFVTEELWTVLAAGRGGAPSLVVAAWPGSDPTRRDLAAESEIAALRQAVTEVRRFRAEQGLKPGQDVPARLSYDPAARPDLAGHERHLRALTKLVAPADPAGLVPTATVTAAGVTVDLDLAGVIDMTAQRNRLTRELAAAVQEAERAAAKLANPAFLANAPPPVVAKIRERLDAARSDLDRLDRQLSELPVGSATGTDR